MTLRLARTILPLTAILGAAALGTAPAEGGARPRDAEACPVWRWVGLARVAGSCPILPGWVGSPLFPRPANPALAHQLGLDRFCLFEVPPAPVSPSVPVPEMPAEGPLLAVDADCAVVTPAADDALEAAMRPGLARNFLAQAGAVELPLSPHATPQTRLALLDTQPTLDSGQGARSDHGPTLAALAHRLACNPTGGCAAEITPRLALANFAFDPVDPNQPQRDEVRGGTFGGLADLAQAIFGEVDAWRRDHRQPHLVLNLSVGWDGERFGGLTEPTVDALPVAMQGVYRALEYANRQGVLVIAAAGNRAAGRITGRPLLPAAWETLGPRRTGPPLLYAVGGVDSSGDPLPNAREGGLPRRVAYGDHATLAAAAADPATADPPAVLTGSSVATAVVSTTAAVVWHYRGDLTPPEVMRLVEQSADRLPGRATFFPGPFTARAAPKLSRISLCPAVALALGGGGGPACLVPRCPPWIPVPPRMARAQRLVAAPLLTVQNPRSFTPGWPCRPRQVRYLGGEPSATEVCLVDAVPESQDQPWANPQPSSDPCPSCALVPTIRQPPADTAPGKTAPSFPYSLKVAIRDGWDGPGCLLARTVDLLEPGGTPVTYWLDKVICEDDGVVEIELDLPAPLVRPVATLYFEMPNPKGKGGSLVIQNEAFVAP